MRTFCLGLLALGMMFVLPACVTEPPKVATLQDGVRCPSPNSPKLAGSAKVSSRSPASVSSAPKANTQTCEKLFGAST